jgi:Ulp1 family protease
MPNMRMFAYFHTLVHGRKTGTQFMPISYNDSHWIIAVVFVQDKRIHHYNSLIGMFTIIYADYLSGNLPLTYRQADMTAFRLKVGAAICRGRITY